MARRRDPNEFVETYTALKRALHAAATQSYAKLELGSTQGKFLRYIGKHTRISQAELARATETDPTLTGRALQTLIERGWVRRERSDEDRREYVLELSASGRRMVTEVELQRAALAASIAGALTERDVEDFERVARKLIAAFAPPVDESGKPG